MTALLHLEPRAARAAIKEPRIDFENGIDQQNAAPDWETCRCTISGTWV